MKEHEAPFYDNYVLNVLFILAFVVHDGAFAHWLGMKMAKH
jgi:hypothetical protein